LSVTAPAFADELAAASGVLRESATISVIIVSQWLIWAKNKTVPAVILFVLTIEDHFDESTMKKAIKTEND